MEETCAKKVIVDPGTAGTTTLCGATVAGRHMLVFDGQELGKACESGDAVCTPSCAEDKAKLRARLRTMDSRTMHMTAKELAVPHPGETYRALSLAPQVYDRWKKAWNRVQGGLGAIFDMGPHGMESMFRVAVGPEAELVRSMLGYGAFFEEAVDVTGDEAIKRKFATAVLRAVSTLGKGASFQASLRQLAVNLYFMGMLNTLPSFITTRPNSGIPPVTGPSLSQARQQSLSAAAFAKAGGAGGGAGSGAGSGGDDGGSGFSQANDMGTVQRPSPEGTGTTVSSNKSSDTRGAPAAEAATATAKPSARSQEKSDLRDLNATEKAAYEQQMQRNNTVATGGRHASSSALLDAKAEPILLALYTFYRVEDPIPEFTGTVEDLDKCSKCSIERVLEIYNNYLYDCEKASLRKIKLTQCIDGKTGKRHINVKAFKDAIGAIVTPALAMPIVSELRFDDGKAVEVKNLKPWALYVLACMLYDTNRDMSDMCALLVRYNVKKNEDGSIPAKKDYYATLKPELFKGDMASNAALFMSKSFRDFMASSVAWHNKDDDDNMCDLTGYEKIQKKVGKLGAWTKREAIIQTLCRAKLKAVIRGKESKGAKEAQEVLDTCPSFREPVMTFIRDVVV